MVNRKIGCYNLRETQCRDKYQEILEQKIKNTKTITYIGKVERKYSRSGRETSRTTRITNI